MITSAEAQALVAEAQAWFSGSFISAPKQKLWAEAITDVREIEVCDVRVALKRLATTPRDGYWKLEVAELILTAKMVMRERRRLTDALTTPLLTAQAAPDAEQAARTRAARDAAIALVLGRLSMKEPT